MSSVQRFFYSMFGYFSTNAWTQAAYAAFLRQRGWEIVTGKTLTASFPMANLKCRPSRRG